MNYRLSITEPIEVAVPSLAASELDAAIGQLKSSRRNHEAIHAARKHFKKTRALLDLVAPVAGGGVVKSSQKRLSSAARSLAASRDAQVAVSAAEALEKEFSDAASPELFPDLVSWLRARCDRIDEKLDHAGVDGALEDLEKAKATLSKLDLAGTKMTSLLESACKTYRRGRHAMKDALDTGEEQALHDWRKKVQRHWRQMRLLKEVSPKESKAHTGIAHDLSDVLGAHHDLALLRETISENRAVFPSPDAVKTLCGFIAKKQSLLAREAATLGERLYAEKPKVFLKRVRTHWRDALQKQTSAVGEAEA